MAPAILAPEAVKVNIPAWKRLGLKLKSAQQESVPYVAPVVVAPAVPEPKKEKRKREIKEQEAPLGKRAKVSKSAKVHEPTKDTTPNQSPISSGDKRRKSVTFTPETKTEDGDSIKQLYNGWVAKHPTQGPNLHELRSRSASKSSEPTPGAEQINSAIDEVLQEVEAAKKPKKEKKAKKAKSPKFQKVVKSTKQLDPALSYLKLFHESKDIWKFNKIHQINLLKNAFDIEKIPSEYIEIFYDYVTGLKGRARSQLRDAAIAIKVKAQEESAARSAEDMDNNKSSEKELEGHLEENVAIAAPDSSSKIGYEENVLQPLSDLTIKQRLAKRMRAERILDELAQEAQEPGEEVNGSSESIKDEEEDRESQKRLKMSDGSTQRVRRKRKQRTNAVDDSSSSDSSDSDSSSEDDDDDDEDEEEESQEPTEEESSSSSSSSSSTSEDGEDSGSSESGSGSDDIE
jgi:hypothetical protein